MQRESDEDQVRPGVTTEHLQNIEMTWHDFRNVADDLSLWKNCVLLHLAGLRSKDAVWVPGGRRIVEPFSGHIQDGRGRPN